LSPLACQEDIDAVAAGLDGSESDCAITVALKITDDSCKMDTQQRALFMALYDALQQPESELFDADIHAIIERGRKAPSAATFSRIKVLREMAMERIGRPDMKRFKAAVRERLKTRQNGRN
jgi:hypothetical protein